MMSNTELISVYLVDDDIMFLKSLEHHLLHRLKSFVQIKSFPTGEEFINSLGEKPDIVILDYVLGGTNENMNGMDILRKVRESSPGTEVIMLSAQDQLEVAIQTIKHGAYDYVVKNENAFLKTQNLIRNAITSITLKRQVKTYNFWIKVILSVIALILVTAITIELVYKNNIH
jgi:two-component system OmpR family response regulator